MPEQQWQVAVFQSRAFVGHAGIIRLYGTWFQNLFTGGKRGPVKGLLLDHFQLQDVITVAPDRKTAKGRFRGVLAGGWHDAIKDSLPEGMPRWEVKLAHFVHAMFYVLLLALPLTGWFMESIGPRPLHFWGAVFPHFPAMPGLLEGQNKRAIKDTMEWVHGTPLVWTMVALIGLHVLGAIKHQFDGHPILWRMIPGVKPRA